MGDVVLTLPAITDMQRQVPGIEIDWLVEKPFASIAQMHPGVSKVHAVQWRKWRKSLWKSETRVALQAFRAALRDKPYDLIIDFQGQIAKSVVLGAMARGPLAGFAWQGLREPLSSLFYARKAEVSKTLHLVPRSRAMAAALLGFEAPQSPPDYNLRVQEPFWLPTQSVTSGVSQVPMGLATPRFALLIPHASRPEKHWPEERWVAVLVSRQTSGSATHSAFQPRPSRSCPTTIPSVSS